jgi:hypothetical protein
MTDPLDQLTDAELSERFAVEVAQTYWPVPLERGDKKQGIVARFKAESIKKRPGAQERHRGVIKWVGGSYGGDLWPSFATSADAVLPFTDAFPFCDITRESHLNGKPWSVGFARTIEGDDAVIHALAPTLARAICIALIRAKRAEKGAAS